MSGRDLAHRSATGTERRTWPVVVVGGGQAGLATGELLRRASIPAVILDAHARTGDAWRLRWPSLTLFTPARYSSLPGWPMPEPAGDYPTAAEMADYLEAYAAERELDVRTGVRVDHLRPTADGFELATSAGAIDARRVVVATGAYHDAHLPPVAAELPATIATLHSRDYRGPESVAASPVVVVGTGSSGLQIAVDLARAGRAVTLAGRRMGSLPRRVLGRDVYDVLYGLGLLAVRADRWPGREIAARSCESGDLLLGQDLEGSARRHGIRRTDRVVAVDGDALVDDRGVRIRAASVVWCTGFRNRWPWIEGRVTDDDGRLRHRRGESLDVAGLHFVGQPGLHHLGSSLIGFAERDAAIVVEEIVRDLDAKRAPSP